MHYLLTDQIQYIAESEGVITGNIIPMCENSSWRQYRRTYMHM